MLLTSLFAAVLAASSASADVIQFLAEADGIQAATGSSGTATISVTLDDVTGLVTVTGVYSGLGSNRIDQHIHGLAGPGGNAPVIVPLSGTGTTSGTIFGSGTLPTPALIAGMIAGQTYFNLHTTTFGGGEIRGQVIAVPESSVLIGGAIATAMTAVGLTSVRRRRRCGVPT
jgi:hypothetical protein